MYARTIGSQEGATKAAMWLEKAAEQNVPDAQYLLGHYYFEGKGVGKNPGRGLALLKSSANQGFVEAQYSLDLAYLLNEDVPYDEELGVTWLVFAARNGHSEARSDLQKLGLTW